MPPAPHVLFDQASTATRVATRKEIARVAGQMPSVVTTAPAGKRWQRAERFVLLTVSGEQPAFTHTYCWYLAMSAVESANILAVVASSKYFTVVSCVKSISAVTTHRVTLAMSNSAQPPDRG